MLQGRVLAHLALLLLGEAGESGIAVLNEAFA